MSAQGQPTLDCTSRWGMNAPARHQIQCRGAVSSSAAVRIALGGQMSDGVAGGRRNASPAREPT